MSREISVSLSHFLVRPRLVRFIVYLGANKGLARRLRSLQQEEP